MNNQWVLLSLESSFIFQIVSTYTSQISWDHVSDFTLKFPQKYHLTIRNHILGLE